MLVHTGQHYDEELSQVFFDELGLPAPEHHLDLGGGSNTDQTARMLARSRPLLAAERPDLGARLRRHQLDAGGRAGRRPGADPGRPRRGGHALVRPRDAGGAQPRARRPRRRPAAVLLRRAGRAPARRGRRGASRGGRRRDGRRRAAARRRARARAPAVLEALRRGPGEFLLATAHRAGNVDDPARLARLVALLEAMPVRSCCRCTRARARAAGGRGLLDGWRPPRRPAPPLGYLDFTALLLHARAVLTDSGGVQKEAYLAAVPCVTLRSTTEWTETVDAGWNALVDLDADAALARWSASRRPSARRSTATGAPASASSRRCWRCARRPGALDERRSGSASPASATGARTWRATSPPSRAASWPGAATPPRPRERWAPRSRPRASPPTSTTCSTTRARRGRARHAGPDPRRARRARPRGRQALLRREAAGAVGRRRRARGRRRRAQSRARPDGRPPARVPPGRGQAQGDRRLGELGDIHYIYSNRLNLGQLRADENALWSLGAHDVSVVLHLADEEPYELDARGESYMRRASRTSSSATCASRPGSPRTCTSRGSTRTRSAASPSSARSGWRRSTTWTSSARSPSTTRASTRTRGSYGEYITRSGDIWSPRIANREPLRLECEHFVECLREGARRCRTGQRAARGARARGLQERLDASRRGQGAAI